jgi:hypothetical protein
MDLLSLDGGERYHTLAALINIGTPEHDEFLLTGFLPDDRRDRVSRIIHEVTHVGSLRTARLGFLIARVAAETLRGRKQITRRSLTVPDIAETVLGAFSPLLEGLALYGQLDYRINDEEEDILPFPINKIAANNTADFLVSANGVPDAIRNAQLAAIWGLSAGSSRIGILSALLLDDDAETEHYFAGYLFVKAIAARFSRLDSRLADPATFLPLLVRLTCDHPILETACFEPMSCQQIIGPPLRFVQDISQDDLHRILRMLEREDVRENFDNWDIHAQLAAANEETVILHTQDNVIFRGMLTNGMFSNLRAATSVHLTSWTTGTIRALDFRDAEAIVQILRDGHDVTVRIMRYGAINAFSAIDARSREALHRFEGMFHGQLAWAMQKKLDITVGSYVTLTRGSAGMALWVKERLAAIIPLSLLDSRLDGTETHVALDGLKVSPTFRRKFAEGLRSSDTLRASNRQADARSQAADIMMAALVSDSTWATIALRCRLTGMLPCSLVPSIRDWCSGALSPGGAPAFPSEVSIELSTIFDRPGVGGCQFNELVPDLLPLADHLRRLQDQQRSGGHNA